MAKPPYITERKANILITINNPTNGENHWTRIICIAPRTRKMMTKYSPLDIHEVFHPDESTIRQDLNGFPRKRRCKPPPNTAQISQPINIPNRVPKIEATINVPAPNSIKKKLSHNITPRLSIHSRCGVYCIINS